MSLTQAEINAFQQQRIIDDEHYRLAEMDRSILKLFLEAQHLDLSRSADGNCRLSFSIRSHRFTLVLYKNKIHDSFNFDDLKIDINNLNLRYPVNIKTE